MPSLYTIRPLDLRTPRELEVITCFSVMTIWESRAELRQNPANTPGYGWAETHARLRAAASSPNARLLVAVDGDGHVVASSVSVVRQDSDGRTFGYFWSRYTLPRMRRMGISTTFIGDAESWYRSRACQYAEVHIHPENRAGRGLFESRGYKVTDRGRDDHWAWIVMTRDL